VSAGEPIVVERVIRARPERVFAAFSDAKSMAVWMCPGEDMTHASVELDFRVGGRFRIVMHGAERDYTQHGEYLAIEANERIQMTWISEFVPEVDQSTRVTVHFEPAGDATRVRLVHDELPANDTYQGHTDGWSTILVHLSDAITP
jgi:uncharacterized protein YndB with AHSA1/START domain